jgi:Dolichyl-phosphate-mannose-protein mannosyltransferase
VVTRGERAAEDARERTLVIALLVAASLLRLAYIFRFRIDSDEPQHLHVVWAWTQGLLPYRDVFDNHMPLFHLLYAPLLDLLGEQPRVLIMMRIAMVPLYILALVALHRIARTLFSRRTAGWVVVLAALVPGFFLCSLEFRADDLWTALWLLALGVTIEGRVTPARSAAVGLLLGAALAVSLKTVLMLLAVGGAATGTLLLARHRPTGRAPLARCAVAALAGLTAAPLAVTALFASRGALEPYLYGTVWHNLTPGLGDWSSAPHRWKFFPPLLLLYVAAYRIARAAPGPGLGARRAFVFMATGIYLTGLVTLWPLRTHQDYLPVTPLITLFCTPLLVQLGKTRAPACRIRALAPALVAVAFLGNLLGRQTLWSGRAADSTALIGDVLRLTAPGEPVMDLKGEAVFRPRPFYYALEHITQERIHRGLIVEDIPERLIASRTTVAVGCLDHFPARTARFLGENYVRVGTLRVAGQMIAPNPATGDRLLFDIRIPARYTIVTDGAPAGGQLDGTPYDGPRFLDSGLHAYTPAPADGRIAVLWSRAAERNFSPFHPPELHG